MKKLIVICLMLGFYSSSHAQTWRLNGYAFYVFDDKVDNYATSTSYYSTTLKGGLVWGGSLEYMLQNAYGVEFKYLRQDTKAPISILIMTKWKAMEVLIWVLLLLMQIILIRVAPEAPPSSDGD